MWNTFTGSVLKKSNKFMVWGESMKLYCKEYGISENQFEVLGNPYYDNLFNENYKTSNHEEHVLLITQGPAINFHINDSLVKTNDDYEKKLKLICKTVIKNKKKLIIKLHPYEITNNEDKICKEIDPEIRVIKKGNIISLINSCSVLISLGTSLSTAILEAHILKKPVLRMPFAEWMGKPDLFRKQFCFNTNEEEFAETFKKIYEDEAFHNKITKIGHEFLNAYLANKGNAAENIAHYIKKLVNEKCQIH
jgi:CDP-glycerol glycerophosphotransferase (TagB/SpsB family)